MAHRCGRGCARMRIGRRGGPDRARRPNPVARGGRQHPLPGHAGHNLRLGQLGRRVADQRVPRGRGEPERQRWHLQLRPARHRRRSANTAVTHAHRGRRREHHLGRLHLRPNRWRHHQLRWRPDRRGGRGQEWRRLQHDHHDERQRPRKGRPKQRVRGQSHARGHWSSGDVLRGGAAREQRRQPHRLRVPAELYRGHSGVRGSVHRQPHRGRPASARLPV